ncbi:MAG: zinc-dependent metalloprotease [Butyricimonas paravirosa]
MRDFPGRFNSEDLTVSCFRYIPTEEANAAGRVWTDPRSGEIIQADILWYHNVVRLLQEWRFIQTAAADPRARNKELSEEIMGELIRYAVAHETGHTLGMKHNMRASFAYPVDSLRSPSFTRKYGTTASIMDYARNNYVAQPGDFERGVKMTPPILGPFDYFSVQWAYTPIFDVKTPEEELPVLDRMFREKGHDPLYLYANMAMGPVVPDPSGQSDMLGDDLLKSSTYGILNLRYIMSHLIDWCSDKGGSYDRMIEMYDAGVKQFSSI